MLQRIGCAFLGLLACGATRAEDRPLTYRLAVGDRLVYEQRLFVAPLGSEDYRPTAVEQVQVWCLRGRDARWMILADWLRAVDGQEEPTDATIFQMRDHGRRETPAELIASVSPDDPTSNVLPILPLPVQTGDHWVTAPDAGGRRWRCTNHGADGEHQGHLRIDFVMEDPSRVSEALGQQRTGRYWFDPAQGLVTRFESQALDTPAQQQTKVVAVLRQKRRHSTHWAERRAEEVEHYLKTLRHEERLLADALADPAKLADALQQVEQLWNGFQSDLNALAKSPLARVARGHLARRLAEREQLQKRAALGRRWLGKPARPWSLQTLGGETLTSEAWRTGVVIECFWSASSAPGLRGLAAFRVLQDQQGRFEVPVLCLNMDYNVQQAKWAAQACGQGLRHVLAGPLQDAEQVPEFPVVRVLDENGAVRGLWIGWRPEYTEAHELAQRLAAAAAP